MLPTPLPTPTHQRLPSRLCSRPCPRFRAGANLGVLAHALAHAYAQPTTFTPMPTPLPTPTHQRLPSRLCSRPCPRPLLRLAYLHAVAQYHANSCVSPCSHPSASTFLLRTREPLSPPHVGHKPPMLALFFKMRYHPLPCFFTLSVTQKCAHAPIQQSATTSPFSHTLNVAQALFVPGRSHTHFAGAILPPMQ